MGLSKRKMANESTVKDLLGGNTTRRTRSVISEEAMHHVLESLTHNYQNPIEGLVREAISNAIDATILLPEAERRPVEVITPSSYNMQFTVIDHGCGMDLETLEENFVQYGMSLKLDDLDQTGSFGMGAKAPLAYTHEFKAVTVKDGVKITYIVQRENNGIWGSPIKTEDTDEPNGTTITVALESEEDISEFSRVTNEYVKHSYDLPVIVDGKETTFFDYYLEVGSIVMDEASGTAGRVWMHKDNFYKFMLLDENRGGYVRSLDVRYLVTGWEYELLGDSRKDMPDAYVELKPGLVNFNQSRDSIVENERSKRLKLLIQRVLFENDEQVREYMIRAFNQLTVEEATAVWKELDSRQTLRTLHSENNQPVDEHRTIRIREMLMDRVDTPMYSRGYELRAENPDNVDAKGMVYREFRFTAGEVANRDGNAILDMIAARERGESIKYVFLMSPDRRAADRHHFDALNGDFGIAWSSRNTDNPKSEPGRFGSEEIYDPQIIPKYATPDRKGILTEYGKVARFESDNFNVTPEYLFNMVGVHNIILVVSDNGEQAASLVRQRERVAEMFKGSGITAVDGTKHQYTVLSEEESRYGADDSLIAIGHISAADVEALPTPAPDRNVVIVNYEMLREELRKQNAAKRAKKVKKNGTETPQQRREATVFQLDVHELLGQPTATTDEIAVGFIDKLANWTYQQTKPWIKPNTHSNEKATTLEEIQSNNGIIIISSHTTIDNFSMPRDLGTPELITRVIVDRANAGQPVPDGTKFYVFNSRAFSAQEQQYLAQHVNNLYVSPAWLYASKASDKLREQFTIQWNMLQSAFVGLSDLEIATFSMTNELRQMKENRVPMEVISTLLQDDVVRKAAEESLEFIDGAHNVTSKVALLHNMQSIRVWNNGTVAEHMPDFASKDFADRVDRIRRYFRAFLNMRSELSDFENRSRRNIMYNNIDVSALSTQYAMEASMAYNLLDMVTGNESIDHGEHPEDLMKVQTLRDILTRQAVARIEDKFSA